MRTYCPPNIWYRTVRLSSIMKCDTPVSIFYLIHLLVVAGQIGISSSGPVLSIEGNSWQRTCSSSVIVTCTLQTAPLIVLSWLINGTLIAECGLVTCLSWPALPSHYVPTVESGTVYHLSIDPVKLTDNYVISCTDGVDTQAETMSVNAEFIAEMFTNQTTEQANGVTTTLTTNCVSSPSNIEVYLTYKQEPSSTAFVDYSDGTSVTDYIACTNGDNPHCGGSTANKSVTTITIPTNSDGEMYIFRLVVKEYGTIVYQEELGRYRITDNTTNTVSTDRTTSTQSPERTNSPTPSPTADTNTPFDISSSVTSTHLVTTTDNHIYVMQEPYIYLTVGGGLLTIMIGSFSIHMVFICVRGNKRNYQVPDNSKHIAQTDEFTNLENESSVL